MKTKLIFASLLLLGALFSCKKQGEKEVIEQTKPITFDIIVDIKIKKDDDLIIYYKDGSNQWIVEDKAVWVSVKGSDQFQTVIFNLPEDVLPIDFRFDIGRNEFKNQDPIEIRKVTLSYLKNKFEVSQDQFKDFFKPNEYITFDEVTKQYLLKKNNNGGYDPYFEPTPFIYGKLSSMVLE